MMRRSHLRASIPIAVLLLATAATAAPNKDPPALQVPIVGSASSGAAFAGTLSILRFEARANQVVAIGIVRGTVAAGTALVGEVALPVQVTAASQAAPASSSSALVAQPQVAPQQTATCTALNLNLGAVNLNVLGLVHLHRLPSLHLLVGLFFRNPVPFLYFAHELVPLTGDDGKVVIGKLAPLFLDSPLHLIPFSFCLFPIHGILLW